MAASRIRLITVDVTNTLIRVKGSPAKQYAQVAHSFGIAIDDNSLSDIWLQKYKKFSLKYPNFGSADQIPASEWWCGLVKECFHSVNPSLDGPLLDKVADSLYLHFTTSSAWELLPGASDALKDLRQYPVMMAVISNWDDRLEKVLHALQMDSYFDFVLSSYNVGIQKPDPAIFHQAIKKAGCEPKEAVHLGDDFEKDFVGARNAGMESYILEGNAGNPVPVDSAFAVKDMQCFVDTIRHRLGELQRDPS